MSYDKNILEFDIELKQLSSYAKGTFAKQTLLDMPILKQHDVLIDLWNDLDNMMKMHTTYGQLPINHHYEIKPLLSLISKGHVCDLEEMISIKKLIDLSLLINEYQKNILKHIDHLPFFEKYPLPSFDTLSDEFNRIFDMNFLIKDHASDSLNKIRKKLAVVDQRYQHSIQQALKTYATFLNEHMIVTRDDALCIAVNEAFKGKVKGSVIDMSQSKQTVYIEPAQSRIIREEKNTLLQEEKQEILMILAKLTQYIYTFLDDLFISIDTLLIYDIFQAKALYTHKIRGVRPIISNHEIHLVQARHPQLKEQAIPINIDIKKENQGLFITGPNTGGKTVSLKTVGLIQLLAQSGLFIPAEEHSTIMLFNHIFADIGDAQSISHNLSTFSGHLTKHIRYLSDVDDHTLLLIDEIGSGTDPQEGVALAKSLLNAYLSKGALLMITTHYQTLKEFAIKQYMDLASVAFNEETLSPLYHLIMGVAGQSHAFDIAHRLGLPDDVLSNAKYIYESSQSDAEKLLRALEKKELLLIEQEKEVFKKQQQLQLEKETQMNEKESFEIYKKHAVNDAIKEKNKRLDEKIDEVSTMLKILKNESTSLPVTSKIKGQLKTLTIEKEVKNISFDVGESVYIDSYDQIGTIVSKKNNRYDVQIGYFNMIFTKDDLSKTNEKPIEVKSQPKTHISKPRSQYIYEIDLRGFRFEDVKPELEKAIDQAVLSNQDSLRVIHGFGTGAVRKAVYQYIKDHPNIKSHRFGQEGEGLNGVTVLTLK